MRNRVLVGLIGVALVGGFVLVQAQSVRKPRLNPMIELLEQKKPVFGLYAPSNRRAGGRGGPGARGPASAEAAAGRAATPADAPAPPQKTPLELAREAVAFKQADFIFDGSMEGGVDRGLPAYAEFVKGMQQAGALRKTPSLRLTHPLVVKMQEIGSDPDTAVDAISSMRGSAGSCW